MAQSSGQNLDELFLSNQWIDWNEIWHGYGTTAHLLRSNFNSFVLLCGMQYADKVKVGIFDHFMLKNSKFLSEDDI